MNILNSLDELTAIYNCMDGHKNTNYTKYDTDCGMDDVQTWLGAVIERANKERSELEARLYQLRLALDSIEAK